MTITERRWLRISTVMLGLAILGAVSAERVRAQGPSSCLTPTSCVALTLTANLQITNAHPAVTHALVECTAHVQNGEIYGRSDKKALTNRAITDTFTAAINIPKSYIASSASHSLNISCEMLLAKNGGNAQSDITPAVASATQPEGVTNTNWGVVATGSTVKWTQAVTFPNANVP